MVNDYLVFHRTWWRENPQWSGGLEPHAGRKTKIGYANTEEEARKMCQEWNARHPAGRLSRKAEYQRE